MAQTREQRDVEAVSKNSGGVTSKIKPFFVKRSEAIYFVRKKQAFEDCKDYLQRVFASDLLRVVKDFPELVDCEFFFSLSETSKTESSYNPCRELLSQSHSLNVPFADISFLQKDHLEQARRSAQKLQKKLKDAFHEGNFSYLVHCLLHFDKEDYFALINVPISWDGAAKRVITLGSTIYEIFPKVMKRCSREDRQRLDQVFSTLYEDNSICASLAPTYAAEAKAFHWFGLASKECRIDSLIRLAKLNPTKFVEVARPVSFWRRLFFFQTDPICELRQEDVRRLVVEGMNMPHVCEMLYDHRKTIAKKFSSNHRAVVLQEFEKLDPYRKKVSPDLFDKEKILGLCNPPTSHMPSGAGGVQLMCGDMVCDNSISPLSQNEQYNNRLQADDYPCDDLVDGNDLPSCAGSITPSSATGSGSASIITLSSPRALDHECQFKSSLSHIPAGAAQTTLLSRGGGLTREERMKPAAAPAANACRI